LTDKEFLRQLYACLDDDSSLSIKLESNSDNLVSLLKMTGFTAFMQTNSHYMTAHKPAFKVGGTSLKDRKILAEKQKVKAPAIIVIGDVVALSQENETRNLTFLNYN
jgi:siroheme synthase